MMIFLFVTTSRASELRTRVIWVPESKYLKYILFLFQKKSEIMVNPRISLLIFTIPGFHWFSLLGFSQQSWFSSVQSFSYVQLFTTPWTAARQASLSIIDSQSLLKLMFIESVMPSNHLILRHPLKAEWHWHLNQGLTIFQCRYEVN